MEDEGGHKESECLAGSCHMTDCSQARRGGEGDFRPLQTMHDANRGSRTLRMPSETARGRERFGKF